jgi:CheY-like chemotaxis protein
VQVNPLNGKIVLIVEDLFFLSKILESAQRVAVPVETVAPDHLENVLSSNSARAVIIDLNHRSGRAIELLGVIRNGEATPHIPVIGFLSHVQSDLAKAARQAGCDQVLARSAFSQRLSAILLELTASQ